MEAKVPEKIRDKKKDSVETKIFFNSMESFMNSNSRFYSAVAFGRLKINSVPTPSVLTTSIFSPCA